MGLFSGAQFKQQTVSPERALPGRATPFGPFGPHAVLGTPIEPPFPEATTTALFGLGCFWGAERRFWQMEGVHTTAVGYSGGHTPNPTYEEVCTGRTGHAETVLVVFDPARTSYEALVASFFEGHDPTQLMRQGNDVGTQYRSAIFTSSAGQQATATEVRDRYQAALGAAAFGRIVTEIADAGLFYYAEDHHQQYLAKNPGGYCGLGGTGVACPVGTGAAVEKGPGSPRQVSGTVTGDVGRDDAPGPAVHVRRPETAPAASLGSWRGAIASLSSLAASSRRPEEGDAAPRPCGSGAQPLEAGSLPLAGYLHP